MSDATHVTVYETTIYATAPTAFEAFSAIMHGATWWACLTCRGSGKQGRRKCAACKGACTRVSQAHLDALRDAALAACPLA